MCVSNKKNFAKNIAKNTCTTTSTKVYTIGLYL